MEFFGKEEVGFIVKDSLKVTEAINVCDDISDRETFSREVTGLVEALEYFELEESLLITADALPQAITEKGLKINITPFYQWALAQ